MNTPQKKQRSDGQISGLAGELFVAAELLKRGLQTSVTFGNAKAVDLLAYDDRTDKSFSVQVKTVRSKNYFLINHAKIKPSHVYVFVILNKPGQPVQYYVVPGAKLKNDPQDFGAAFSDPKLPGIYPKVLERLGYENKWDTFE